MYGLDFKKMLKPVSTAAFATVLLRMLPSRLMSGRAISAMTAPSCL